MCKTDHDLQEIADQIKALQAKGYINVNHFLDAQGWHYAHLTLTGWLYRHDVLPLDSYQDYYPAPLPQNPIQLTSDYCTLYFSGLEKNRISQKIRQNISLYQSGHLTLNPRQAFAYVHAFKQACDLPLPKQALPPPPNSATLNAARQHLNIY